MGSSSGWPPQWLSSVFVLPSMTTTSITGGTLSSTFGFGARTTWVAQTFFQPSVELLVNGGFMARRFP